MAKAKVARGRVVGKEVKDAKETRFGICSY